MTAPLSRRIQELIAVYETSLEINSQRDLPTLLDAIVERAARLVGSPMGGLYLMDPDGQSLELVVSYNLPGNLRGTRLRLGEGFSGRIAQTGEIMTVDDYEHWEGRAAAFSNRHFSRVLGVPLKIEGRVIGVINITDVETKPPFCDDDIRLVSLLANQAAIAIHNAQLYQAAQAELAERKRVEERLVRINASLDRQLRFTEALLSAIPTPVFFKDLQGRYLGCNQAFSDMTGVTAEALRDKTVYELWPGELAQMYHQKDLELMANPEHQQYEFFIRDQWGANRDVIFAKDVFYDETGNVAGLVGAYVDITDRKRAEKVQAALYRISEASQTAADLNALYHQIHTIIAGLMPANNFYIALYDPQAGVITFPYYADEQDPAPPPKQPGHGLTEWVLNTGEPLLATAETFKAMLAAGQVEQIGSPSVDWLGVPLKTQQGTLGMMAVQTYTESVRLGPADQDLLLFVSTQAAMAIERKRAAEALRRSEAELQRRAEQLSLLYDAGLTLNRSLDSRSQLEALSQIAMQALHADNSSFFRYDPVSQEIRFEFGVGSGVDLVLGHGLRAPLGQEKGLIGWVAQQRRPFYLPEVSADPRWITIDPELRSSFWVPIEHEDRLLGLLSVGSRRPGAFSPDDRRLLTLFANQVAVALDKQWLLEAERQQREFSETLHWLSQEIVSTLLEPERVYTAIHQATLQLMKADVFVVSELDPAGDDIRISYFAEQGQRTEGQRFPRGRGLSGRVIESGRPVIINDVEVEGEAYDLIHLGAPLPVRSILAVPMRLGDRVLGMLSPQNYQPQAYSPKDARLLEILAAYAAVALENARLFAQMQAAHTELANAYEATIAGWSRALEMRDKETRGHSDRVTRLAMLLAHELGLSEEELQHFRRGVLLHDIGKMAVPDYILLKPGPLSDDEWQVMRQHPLYAYQMLAPIAFLKGAIDIPYCHHERWDGTGYPRGLKGEEIPLGARIFALVDVWDALLSNRPYRPNWENEAVRAHIVTQSGRHFDPQVVKAFLRLLDRGAILLEGG